MLQELLDLGFHDTKVDSLCFDFQRNVISMQLKVIIGSSTEGSVVYRKGMLCFNQVSNCNLTDEFDFINAQNLVLLSGEIDDTSCNLFLTSNQRFVVSCGAVEFNWVDAT